MLSTQPLNIIAAACMASGGSAEKLLCCTAEVPSQVRGLQQAVCLPGMVSELAIGTSIAWPGTVSAVAGMPTCCWHVKLDPGGTSVHPGAGDVAILRADTEPSAAVGGTATDGGDAAAGSTAAGEGASSWGCRGASATGSTAAAGSRGASATTGVTGSRAGPAAGAVAPASRGTTGRMLGPAEQGECCLV